MPARAPIRFVLLLAAAAALAAVTMAASPRATLASCMVPPPIEKALADAEIVVVGTVVSTIETGRWASVQVDEIWRGPEFPVEILVKGGPAGNQFTSVDRSFEVGKRYLFTLTQDVDGSLLDNACSNTTEWSAELEDLRPEDARTPTGGEQDQAFNLGGLVPVGLLVLAVAAALLVTGLVVRGRDS